MGKGVDGDNDVEKSSRKINSSKSLKSCGSSATSTTTPSEVDDDDLFEIGDNNDNNIDADEEKKRLTKCINKWKKKVKTEKKEHENYITKSNINLGIARSKSMKYT